MMETLTGAKGHIVQHTPLKLLHFLFLFLGAATLLATSPADAQQANDQTYAKIRILPERSTIKAGEEIWIAIEQSIAPKWHTYWKNPGDSGAVPRIQWTLPKGFSVSDISFPTPDKIPYEPLLNYGYSNHTILLQKITAPQNLPVGTLTLKADFEVLVCKEECIPEFSEHELTLNNPQSIAENNSQYINSAKLNLPKNTDWLVYYSEDKNDLILQIKLNNQLKISDKSLKTIEYFPADWGLIENTANARAQIKDGILEIKQARGDRALSALKSSSGLLTYIDDNDKRRAYEFTAQQATSASANAPESTETTTDAPHQTTLIKAIIFAMLGGLILNLMPCVFPVLSIKALSLVKIAEKKPALARIHGLSYTAGVIMSFLAIAGLLIALKASGAGIGWGFQLQNPIVVSVLAYILFIVGMNLSGYFEISTSFGNAGSKLTQGNGPASSFFTGVLATLVATPCSAPFMALAIGYALLQPTIIGLAVFAALGFGLALPYLLLSFAPPLLKALPKPGAWMETFRQFLAFPMFASAAWLVWVLSQQAGSMGVLGLLFGVVFITFGLWLIRSMPKKGIMRIITKALVVLSFLAPLALLPAGELDSPAPQATHSAFGETYSAEHLETLLSGNDPVFVEMTAAWCITCKVNHAVAINKDSTRTVFADNNVQYLIGDWTNYDQTVTEFLNKYGHQGVPLYVYYGPRNEKTGERPAALVLPQILTPATIKNAVEESIN